MPSISDADPGADPNIDRPRWRENAPFWSVHLAAVLGAIAVGWSRTACAWLIGSYLVRMFAITAGYHRYFAHRTFKTSRVFQFVLALLAMSSAQRGVLWWASHHRFHHKHSDGPQDVHSPVQRGFWWSHAGWMLGARHKATHDDRIRDLVKYPELRFLNRIDLLVAVAWGFALYAIGGATAVFWGHFVSLVLAWHATFCINSLAHVWGTRRYATSDDSRNNWWLALLTLGEGWHNNHHHYQRTARQGFYWWQVDFTYYGLKALEVLHIVWDVEGVPRHVRDETVAPERARILAAVPVVPEIVVDRAA
ncbi:MAG TPA: acyl-CoA desaturase [Kofleriaceae bacterium]|jgi:stearoyl-CoA desaturase (delta-9 desaturase)|nr:acyl-CoA desaturase [Kofleriaceae bacterium]